MNKMTDAMVGGMLLVGAIFNSYCNHCNCQRRCQLTFCLISCVCATPPPSLEPKYSYRIKIITMTCTS